MRCSKSLTLLACVVLFAAGPTACRKTTHVSTSAAGHAVTLEIVGPHSVTNEPSRASIQSVEGTVVIEATRMRLNEANWTEIQAGVPIDIRIRPGNVVLKAGNVTVKHSHN